MSDPRQAAAETAFPESEFTQRATTFAMREAVAIGWDAAKEDSPTREHLRRVIEASVERHCEPHDGYPDIDDLTNSVLAAIAGGRHNCDQCDGDDPSTCPNATHAEEEIQWGYEYEVDHTTSFTTRCDSEAEARACVADSPTDTGLRRSINRGPWMEVTP